MTILIANIGTSDLAVKVEEYYIPVGFDRNEPNIDYSDLTEDEKIMWEQQKLRQEYVTEYLCPELNVKVDSNNPKNPFSFLKLTEKLLDVYQQDEEKWHPRIRPGRISGVIKTAVEKFNVKDIYIFVTKQEPPHFGDSIYLFDILQKWFKKELDIQLIPEIIPADIPAVDLDNLLDYYYGVFVKYISRDSELLISLKGGTPQMKTAISMQAFASSINKQIFIDPVLSPAKILAGEPSECQLTSYWRYMRNQKYQDVKILLEERWDFDGAIQLIKQWQNTLKFLNSHLEDIKISQINHLIFQVFQALEIANYCLNLDWKTAKENILDKYSDQVSREITNKIQPYDLLLNLYTQCRIYYELNQMSNFLVGVSSFYEIVLEKIAKSNRIDKKKEYPQKGGRYDKRDFIDKIISKSDKSESWSDIIKYLKELDFWCSQRNQLIHHGKGISKELMKELYERRSNADKDVCPPNSILDVMTQILKTDFNLLRNQQYQKYVGRKADYYIYSAVREWAIARLMDEGLK